MTAGGRAVDVLTFWTRDASATPPYTHTYTHHANMHTDVTTNRSLKPRPHQQQRQSNVQRCLRYFWRYPNSLLTQMMCQNEVDSFSRIDTIPACNKQTVGRTQDSFLTDTDQWPSFLGHPVIWQKRKFTSVNIKHRHQRFILEQPSMLHTSSVKLTIRFKLLRCLLSGQNVRWPRRMLPPGESQ